MNRPLRLALVLVGIAIVLAILGLVLRALRWLLYVAIVVLLAAAAVKWLMERDNRDASPPPA